jgi:high frequency lysogenization protein
MKDRVIALAALVQAVEQVQQMANLGQAQTRALEPVIASLFRFDVPDTEAVYDGKRNLDFGIKRLRAQLDGAGRDSFIVRVCMSLIQLERSFLNDENAVAKVQARLNELAPMAEEKGFTHPDLLAALGEIYANVISPLGPKIMVQGNPVYLAQAQVIGEVRAALLAGIRAAVLWRQVGGSFWDFFLRRGAIARELQQLV